MLSQAPPRSLFPHSPPEQSESAWKTSLLFAGSDVDFGVEEESLHAPAVYVSSGSYYLPRICDAVLDEQFGKDGVEQPALTCAQFGHYRREIVLQCQIMDVIPSNEHVE